MPRLTATARFVALIVTLAASLPCVSSAAATEESTYYGLPLDDVKDIARNVLEIVNS